MATTERTLLSLPREMLERVRSHMHSLQDHVNLSLTCRALKGLYDDHFWKFACISAGWGIIKPTAKTKKAMESSGLGEQVLWAATARIVVKDAEIFKHHEDDIKGWASAQSRSFAVIKAPRSLSNTVPAAVFESDMVSLPQAVRAVAIKTPDQVLKEKVKLELLEWCPYYNRGNETTEAGFYMTDYEADIYPGPPLLKHPYVSNRLFSIPRITAGKFCCGKIRAYDDVKNVNGLTIFDIYIAMAAQ